MFIARIIDKWMVHTLRDCKIHGAVVRSLCNEKLNKSERTGLNIMKEFVRMWLNVKNNNKIYSKCYYIRK